MPALKIFVLDGDWVAVVANTEIMYKFVGADLQNQEDMIHILANDMKNGVRDELRDCFQDADENTVDQLFGNSDMLYFKERLAYGTVGEDMLLEDLELAGQGLELALLA